MSNFDRELAGVGARNKKAAEDCTHSKTLREAGKRR
jgi:hypothetical protein